jgi:AraC-like DNA-binding protein
MIGAAMPGNDARDGMRLSSTTLKPVLVGCKLLGVDVPALLAEFGLTEAEIADPDHWVSTALDIRLLNEAARRARDPDFGLHVAESNSLGSVGLFDYVIAAKPTVGAALETSVRLSGLMSNFAWLTLRVDGDLVYFGRRYQASLRDSSRHASEWFLAGTLFRFRHCTYADWAPARIQFTHDEPASTVEHQRIFRTQLRFGAPRDEMVFGRDFLETPLTTADPSAARALEQIARQLALPQRSDRFLDGVRAAIAEQLRGEGPDAFALAKLMRTSPRTLQRKLRQEGTSYHSLLDETRRDLALQHLANPAIAIVEVAFMVGYSSLSTFYAAFQRWTGMSPAKFRRERGLPA